MSHEATEDEVRRIPRWATLQTTPVDFVLLTALVEEHTALVGQLDRFSKVWKLPPDENDIHIYFAAELPVSLSDGKRGKYRLILVSLAAMGHVQAAIVTQAAIHRWRPRNMVLVGIAGGVVEAEIGLGDVLVADAIVDYELQKLTAEGVKHRYQVYPVDPRLRFAAAHAGDGWRALIRESRPVDGVPKRAFGPVASGNKVIALKAILDEHRKSFSKLIGVEMEAGGVAGAAHHAAFKLGFLMVRGVSDLADENKDIGATQNWRAYACDVAAAYTLELLRSGPVPLMRDSAAATIEAPLEPRPKAPTRRGTVETTELLSDSAAISVLTRGDPEPTRQAIDFLRLQPNCGKQLLALDASSPVTLAAIREILATRPEANASIVLDAIKQSGGTGDAWHLARKAADATSPALRRFLESGLVPLLDGEVERSRHAISALGNLGVAMLYQGELVGAVNQQRDKRLSYALDAAVRSFELASDDTLRRLAADLLVTVANIHESHESMTFPYAVLNLNLAHVDLILSRLLTNGPIPLRQAALSWLGDIGAGRGAAGMLSLMGYADDNFKKQAAANIWRIGDLVVVEEMRRHYPEDIALNGVELGLAYVEEPAEFDRLLPLSLQHSDFLTLRAIGLRRRHNHLPLLRQQLKANDPAVRGCASLALARLGEGRELRRSHQEASDVGERTFTALALIEARIVAYESVEPTLRQDLADSFQLMPELQEDIVSVLVRSPDHRARSLAQAWLPFYASRVQRSAESERV